MDVILLEKVAKLGKLGDRVKVKGGYGRNFLIPFGKAVPATEEAILAFEKRREELEKNAQSKYEQAQTRSNSLNEIEISITAKVGEEGKLFGSIGARDLADVISSATGEAVLKSEVRLPNGPIRMIGEYDIKVQLHSDISAMVRIIVAAE